MPAAQTEKAKAVEAEDYDKAKSIKQQIEDLSTPPEPEETEEEKHEKRVLPSRPSSRPPAADRGCCRPQVKVVRQGIADVRDKNHDGDTHKFFDHLDDDDDDHLTDVELMTILGADPKKPRENKGGMFTKIMDSMVAGMKKSIDADGDGKVTKTEFHNLLHGDEA